MSSFLNTFNSAFVVTVYLESLLSLIIIIHVSFVFFIVFQKCTLSHIVWLLELLHSIYLTTALLTTTFINLFKLAENTLPKQTYANAIYLSFVFPLNGCLHLFILCACELNLVIYNTQVLFTSKAEKFLVKKEKGGNTVNIYL